MVEHKQTEKSIFLAAVEIDADVERAAFIEGACAGNPQLRAEVDALLQAHARPQPLLDTAAVDGPVADQLLTELPGIVIGPYKLIEPIGEGGMGTVWMAQQTEPVKRVVALKLIKAGMDSKQIIARFEAERQALALMDHTNIARVLDAGATATGRPYFVMDLVKGVSITKYCDEHHLTPRQRLELFIPVCQAIQHAHQKGIIHRDVKPSNVLVALYDGKPVPKVIDFGVAKATGQQLTEKTLVTGFGNIVGTLEYMSPEQAEINQLDIDTRSDIYSLGVLLYELLTGSTPFSRKELAKAGMLEMLRVIREQEPSKPSTKLSTAEGLPTLAANRGTEPAKLTKLMRGELDWIVMKALEKDRNRRYETANGFAMDVQRYLADEAVQACPPSAGYRLRKFVRRNKGLVVAVSIVALALVGGIVGTTWGLVRAESAREAEAKQLGIAQTKEREAVAAVAKERQATQREAEQRGVAENRRAEADAQRQLAERNFDKAREAVDQMLTAVAENQLAQTPQMEPLRRELLEKAARFYEDFLKDDSKDPNVRAGMAQAYQRLGRLYRLLGYSPKALQAHQSAIKVLEELSAEHPSEPRYQYELAGALQHSAGVLLNLDRFAEAETLYRRVIAIDDALLLQFPDNNNYLRQGLAARADWADTLQDMGRFKESEAAFRQCLATMEKLPVAQMKTWGGLLHRTYSRLAEVLAKTQRPREAEEYYRKALPQALVELAGSPRNAERRIEVLGIQHGLALVLQDTQEAEKLLRESVARAGEVVADFPHTAHYRMVLTSRNLDLCRLLMSARRFDEAEKVLRESLPHAEKLVADAPDRPWHQRLLLNHWFELAALVSVRGQETEAERYILKYLDARRHEPFAYNNAAWALATRPEFKSLNIPARVVAFAKKAVELAPDNGSYVNTLGTAYYRAGDWKAALETLQRAEKLSGGRLFGHNAFFIAMAQEKLGARDEARKWYTAALVWMAKRAPKNEELVRFRAEAAALLGLSEKAANLAPQALSDDLQYLALILDVDARAAWAYQQRAQVLLSRRDYERAIPDFKKAIELDPKNAALHLQFGIALEKHEKLDEAIVALRQAVELSPKDASSYRSLALTLLDLKGPGDEFNRLRKDAERDPSAATAYLILGSVLRDKKKSDEAVACYQCAIELDPNRFAAHFQLGLLLRGQKQLDDAVACFHTCLKLDPNHFHSHLQLGWVLVDQHKPDQALVSFRKAVALDPKHSGAQYGLGRSLVELKEQPQEASAALRKSIQLDPKRADAHNKLGLLLRRQNQLDEAVACFRKTLELDPQSAGAHGQLGSILVIQGKTEEGMALMRKALELNPKLAGSHAELAWYLATAADPKLRNPKAAVSHGRMATALQPDQPYHWRNLGGALLRDGDHKAAAAALEKFEAMTNGAIHSHRFFLAMAYWQIGEKEKARKAYEQAVRWMDKNQPKNEELRRFRAEAAEQLELKEKK